MQKSSYKEAFIISPIGTPGSQERKHADGVYDFIILPATKACGYKATRANQVKTKVPPNVKTEF
jgi:hypothetical protein